MFHSRFEKITDLLVHENYPRLIKQIIDLTLDSEDIEQYKQTVNLLDWLDANENKSNPKEQFSSTLDNLYNLLSNKPVKDTEKHSLLSVNNLIRSYKRTSFALGPVSFEIKPGEIIGLVGENGNGKTTLLRSLCGELKPTGGDIKYHFPYLDEYDLRSQLIYIPQRFQSWRGSLLSNLRFTAASYGIKGRENELTVELIIARMGLRKFRNHSWNRLSSGYKMRFELARALLRKPQLLLIDEPLANLDILAQQIVLDDFRDIAKSAFRPLGVVLSSQQLYEVEKTSDRVLFLKEGVPYNLFEGSGVFREIQKFIVEFETEWEHNRLQEVFSALQMEKLEINGGTYVAVFPEEVGQEDFLKMLLTHKIPVSYFRNISHSTRRFFLS